jgi:hypothetical protein
VVIKIAVAMEDMIVVIEGIEEEIVKVAEDTKVVMVVTIVMADIILN